MKVEEFKKMYPDIKVTENELTHCMTLELPQNEKEYNKQWKNVLINCKYLNDLT